MWLTEPGLWPAPAFQALLRDLLLIFLVALLFAPVIATAYITVAADRRCTFPRSISPSRALRVSRFRLARRHRRAASTSHRPPSGHQPSTCYPVLSRVPTPSQPVIERPTSGEEPMNTGPPAHREEAVGVVAVGPDTGLEHGSPALGAPDCWAPGSLFLGADCRPVKVEDLKEGDKLIGPDGAFRHVTKTWTSKARQLLRVSLSFTGKPKSTANEPHRTDLILTADHPLDLISVSEYRHSVAAHEDTSLDVIKARIAANLIPGLPRPSEPSFTTDTQGKKHKFYYPDFGAALRQAISDSLASHHVRGEIAAGKFIRALTGTSRVSETVQCFVVHSGHSRHADGLKKWGFCWPESQVANVFGTETVQGFSTRQEAYSAAISFARQRTSNEGDTLANLEQRLRGKWRGYNAGFTLIVDDHYNGISIMYHHENMSWSLKFELTVGKKTYIRNYRFPNPHHRFDIATSFVTVVDNPSQTPMAELTNVSVSDDDIVKVKLTAGELRGMPEADMQQFRVHKPVALDYPETAVPVPPKFLGLWLADGIRTCASVANNHEKEVIDYLHEICGVFQLHLKYYSGVVYALTSGTLSTKPLPATKSAQQRGELEPRLLKREMKDLLERGYTRLRPGDDGYKGESYAANFIPPTEPSSSGTTESTDGRPAKQRRLNSPSPSAPRSAADATSSTDVGQSSQLPSASDLYEEVDVAAGDANAQTHTKKRVRRLRRPERLVSPNEADAIADGIMDGHAVALPPAADPPGSRGCNRLLTAMKNLGVIYDYRRYGKGTEHDSKRIPLQYLFNSKKVRQDLLAGFVDGDGHYDYSVNCFTIGQSTVWHMGLLYDLMFLIGSLGYPVNIAFKDGNGRATADGQPDFRPYSSAVIRFSPNDGEFDCLLFRKQPHGRVTSRRTTLSIHAITDAGQGQVHGFEVEGTDHLVLRSDFVIVHDSTNISGIPETMSKPKAPKSKRAMTKM